MGHHLQKWICMLSPRKGQAILKCPDCTEPYYCSVQMHQVLPDMGEKQCGLHEVMIHVVPVLFTHATNPQSTVVMRLKMMQLH